MPSPAADDLDRRIGEREAAAFLGVSPRTLQKWRRQGGGPVFYRYSRRSIRYCRRDLLAFATRGGERPVDGGAASAPCPA